MEYPYRAMDKILGSMREYGWTVTREGTNFLGECELPSQASSIPIVISAKIETVPTMWSCKITSQFLHDLDENTISYLESVKAGLEDKNCFLDWDDGEVFLHWAVYAGSDNIEEVIANFYDLAGQAFVLQTEIVHSVCALRGQFYGRTDKEHAGLLVWQLMVSYEQEQQM